MIIRCLLLALALLNAEGGFGATLGVKNFRQMIASFHQITGISVGDPEMLQVKQRVLSRLPVNGDVSDISSTSVTALYELAGAFCRRMIDLDSARQPAARRAHTLVSFQSAPRALTPRVQEKTILEYSKLFWQREPTADEKVVLTKLFDDAIKGAPAKTEETKNILHAVCSAMAASLDSFVY